MTDTAKRLEHYNSTMIMKVGDIYQTNWGNKCKILMLDDKETITQTIDENNELLYHKYKTQIYSRTEIEFFKSNATLILKSDLTRLEEFVHRPDLPLRLNCFEQLFWSNRIFENIDNFKSFLQDVGIDSDKLKDLKTNKVVIFPSGQQQSLKKPILLENTTGAFSGIDLLFRCFQIQREYIKIEKPYFSRFRLIRVGREEKRLSGIGVYRLGIKGNIPSYYLGGHMSFMELESNMSLIVQ